MTSPNRHEIATTSFSAAPPASGLADGQAGGPANGQAGGAVNGSRSGTRPAAAVHGAAAEDETSDAATLSKRLAGEPPRLLVVDDDRDIGSLVTNVAESCGFEAKSMQDPTQFQTLYRALDPDVILLDVIMPRIDGIELLRFLADERARARILIFATADRRMMELAVNLGRAYGLSIIGIVAKPIHVDELRVRLSGLRD
jgi:CheY-like chemotaxis protein